MTDEQEQAVFGAYKDGKGGIPIPLTIECLLDAMVKAHSELLGYRNHGWSIDYNKRSRQYNAFRERILRMDAEKDAKIALFNVCRGSYDTLLKQQIELDQQLAAKDAENQRLRGLLDFLRPELCVDCYQIYYDYEHPEKEELADDN